MSFQDLAVWQRAMDLCDEVYNRTTQFPSHELYGLTSQLRRAAVRDIIGARRGYIDVGAESLEETKRVIDGPMKHVSTKRR